MAVELLPTLTDNLALRRQDFIFLVSTYRNRKGDKIWQGRDIEHNIYENSGAKVIEHCMQREQ